MRERSRTALNRAAAAALARRRLGGPGTLLPPNNARLLGDLIYLTRLDDFDALAPKDADLGPALGAVADAVRGSREPFGALEVLARRSEGR